MTLAFIFWFLMLLWLLFGVWWGVRPNCDRFIWGGNWLFFLLLLILGWKVFGFPVQG